MIGLALSGGSVRGAYEVGCFWAFKKCHIKFDGFVGTSIGSFNAAFLAAGRERELLRFWQNVKVGELLGLDENLVTALINKHKKVKDYKTLAVQFSQIIKNKGLSTSGLKNLLEEFEIEEDIRKSQKDYGLVTVRLKPLKPLYVFKENIPLGKMNEYILGSCYHPVFKYEKIIDDKYYIDGGFYDAMPVNMLIEKNYEHIYAIDLRAVGIKQLTKDKSRVTILKPSRSLGSIFTLDQSLIRDNIKLGYYDTLKVIKKLDGQKYLFKKLKPRVYTKMVSRVKAQTLKEMRLLFKKDNDRDLVIAIAEYLMKKSDFTYYKVYNIKRVMRHLRKTKINPGGVERFVQALKL